MARDLLNATEVRTGDPIVFTNSDFPVPLPAIDPNHALHGFHEVYSGRDLNLESAVRMSAAFPYVSPAARPDWPGKRGHLVDGGYFDNSGLFTLTKWLKAAIPDLPPAGSTLRPLPNKKILILSIDAFPDGQWAGLPTLRMLGSISSSRLLTLFFTSAPRAAGARPFRQFQPATNPQSARL